MRLIKLTTPDGYNTYVNLRHIATVTERRPGGPEEAATMLERGDGLPHYVRETPEEILALIDPIGTPGWTPEMVAEAFLALKQQDGSAEKMLELALDEDTGNGVYSTLDALGLSDLIPGPGPLPEPC